MRRCGRSALAAWRLHRILLGAHWYEEVGGEIGGVDRDKWGDFNTRNTHISQILYTYTFTTYRIYPSVYNPTTIRIHTLLVCVWAGGR
ncbi:hypothetical protein EON63_24300 [archaeon]|nr:MAG: hypothetical protein EON63_24300 [archaeon]